MRAIVRCGIGLLLLPLIAATAHAGGPPLLEPAGLQSCNGSTWSGITFGQTTKQELGKQCRVSDHGTPLPDSLRLVRPKGDNTSYTALLAKGGKNAPVMAVMITYGVPMSAGDLATVLGARPTALYYATRHDAWRLDAYESKGLLALVSGEGPSGMVLYVLLTRSAFLAPCIKPLIHHATAVVRTIDPHANEPRIASFGSVNATFKLKNATMKDGEKEKLEASMREVTAGGKMRYRAGAAGSFTAVVDIQWDYKRGGTVGVTFALDGQSPYGPMHAEGWSCQTLPKSDRAIMDNASWWYSMAIIGALGKLEPSVGAALDAQGPETPTEARERCWYALVGQIRQAAQQP